MWTAALLLASVAGATEYRLDEAASAVSLEGLLRIVPREIDAARVDYTVLVELHNTSTVTLLVRSDGWQCMRGTFVGPTGRSVPGRLLFLPPGAVERMTLVCDHGPGVRGDFGFTISMVSQDRVREGKEPLPLFTEISWYLREQDVFPERQAERRPLATLTVNKIAPPPPPVPPPPPPPEPVPAVPAP